MDVSGRRRGGRLASSLAMIAAALAVAAVSVAVPLISGRVPAKSRASFVDRQQFPGPTRVASTDVLGCAVFVSWSQAADGGQPVDADALVPGRPAGAVICRYSADQLARSVTVARTQLSGLVATLNSLPAGRSQPGPGFGRDAESCVEDTHRGFVLRFRYGDGSSVAVSVHIGGCKVLSATNGVRTTKIDEPLVTFLIKTAGYDGDYPDPAELR